MLELNQLLETLTLHKESKVEKAVAEIQQEINKPREITPPKVK